jgi:hypothetical protein
MSPRQPYIVCLRISSLLTLPPGSGGHSATAPLSKRPTSASRSAFISISSGLGKPFGTPLASRKEKAAL